MSGLQATPGPWRTGPAHVVAQQTTDEKGRRVTRFVAEALLSSPIIEGEIEANARLIAAAPALYEALVSAFNLMGTTTDCLNSGEPSRHRYAEQRLQHEMDCIRTLLAQARGDTPEASTL